VTEKDPIKRANYGREVGMPRLEDPSAKKAPPSGEVPSLLRISLFAVKGLLPNANDGNNKVITANELADNIDLVGPINQSII
jgi:hypothetical protein